MISSWLIQLDHFQMKIIKKDKLVATNSFLDERKKIECISLDHVRHNWPSSPIIFNWLPPKET